MDKDGLAKVVLVLSFLSHSIWLSSYGCPSIAETPSLKIDTADMLKTADTQIPTDSSERGGGSSVIVGSTADNTSASSQTQFMKPVIQVKNKIGLSKKMFSIATAFVVGTPVCVLRRAKYEDEYGIKGMIGNSDNKMKKFVAGTFWLPFAAITGSLEAPFDALSNGLGYSAFSKDQLSVGKLVQNN